MISRPDNRLMCNPLSPVTPNLDRLILQSRSSSDYTNLIVQSVNNSRLLASIEQVATVQSIKTSIVNRSKN
ncbi:hypothetical protein L6452_08127 [Arctium lappa]|uniref:Uncharacterized protein n=1 Tax=Arctium lappa TaxID=4217 RepID=A0ACB9DHI2_ARCLA|nr:hypothetical protein L6452_08127 [Arctium lappa]